MHCRETRNVNQFKERETWGGGWRHRTQAGLWAGEEEG